MRCAMCDMRYEGCMTEIFNAFALISLRSIRKFFVHLRLCN